MGDLGTENKKSKFLIIGILITVSISIFVVFLLTSIHLFVIKNNGTNVQHTSEIMVEDSSKPWNYYINSDGVDVCEPKNTRFFWE